MAPGHDFQDLNAWRFGYVFLKPHVEEQDAGPYFMGDFVDGAAAAGDFQGVGLAVFALRFVFTAIDGVIGRKNDDGLFQQVMAFTAPYGRQPSSQVTQNRISLTGGSQFFFIGTGKIPVHWFYH